MHLDVCPCSKQTLGITANLLKKNSRRHKSRKMETASVPTVIQTWSFQPFNIFHPQNLPFRTLNEAPTKTKQSSSFFVSSRRNAILLLSLIPAISSPPSSLAFGIPGPKEWLRDQKKKAAKFVLAPIDASRQTLRYAYQLLASSSKVGDGEEIRKLLNSATRDCVVQSRSSVVSFQASTGVEVCTFKLIVKNAASLLGDTDPIKLDAEAKLDDLIRSFSLLDTAVHTSDFQLTSDRETVKDGLMSSISYLDKFEQGIKDCLGV